MDRAVATRNHRGVGKLGKLREAAWSGVAELLEKRMLLSGTTSSAAIYATPSLQPWFIQNAGQWNDSTIRYALKTDAGSIVMTDHGPVFNVIKTTSSGSTTEQFSVHFDGANTVAPTGSGKSEGVYNYLSAGVTGVHGYSQISYNGLYNGIDLQTWGKRDSLKYEFHVAPGADYSQVQLSYDGIKGLSIDSAGRLHVQSKTGELIDDAPVVYQIIDGKRVEIASAFKLIDANTYTFQLNGQYDPSKELVLDPTVTFGTYFGGADDAETGGAIQVDDDGNIYITGATNSTDFPITAGAADAAKTGNGTDAFVAKFDVDGNLVWSTFFGGSRADSGQGIELSHDDSQVFVAGTTASSDSTFPSVISGFQPIYGGGNSDGFVAVFTAGGTLSWASYLGTGSAETVTSTGIDNNDNFYVAGSGYANNTAFVAKIDTTNRLLGFSGSPFLIVTNAAIIAQGLDVAPDGSAFYVVGDTASSTLLVTGRPKDDGRDAFVTAVDVISDPIFGELPTVRWQHYLGGSGNDTGGGIAVNQSGMVAVTGNTASADFPVSLLNPDADTIRGGASDAYVAIYNPAGDETYVSYLGGSTVDTGVAIVTNNTDQFVVVGTTNSIDLPVRNDLGGQFRNNGGNDAFYGVFDATGQFSVLDQYGGNAADTGLDVTVDSTNAIYLTGTTASTTLNQGTDLPRRTNLGQNDVYVARIAFTDASRPPTAPTNLRAVAPNSGGVVLNWTDADNEQGYKIFRATANSGFTQIATVGQNIETYTDTTVEAGVTYFYYVASYRSFFERASNTSKVTTSNPSIKAPTDLTATAFSSTRIDLSWRDNSDNETGFEIWRQETSVGDWQKIFTTGANVTKYSDTGLTAGVEYAYQVRAKNIVRVSAFTDPAVVTSRSSSFLVAPSAVNANRISDTSVSISWQDNSNNETGFVVERADFGSSDYTALTPNASANATSFLDTTAVAGHVYLYRVRAINGLLSSAVSNVATTDANQQLRRPTRVEALSNSSSQIKLTWKDNSTIETGFVIERAQNEPSDWTVIATTAANVTTFYDKHVTTGRRYYYRLRATDGTNFSQYSDRATDRVLARFVTAPRAPSNLRGKQLASTSLRLVWRDNSNEETSYSLERSTSLDGGFQEVAETDVNVNFFTDNKVVVGKTYYYRVRAINGGIRSSPSNILKIKIAAVSSSKAKVSSLDTVASAAKPKPVFSTKKVTDIDENILSAL